MRTTATRIFLALSIAVFALTGICNAATPPVLTLSDGTNTVTIDSTGTVTMNCTPTTDCTQSNVNVVPGQIKWQGKIASLTITATGTSKPKLTAPQIDLALSIINTSSSTKTLTAAWTDTGFNGIGPATMNIGTTFTSVGGSTTGDVSTYNSYLDDGNAAFGTGTHVGTITATPSSPINQLLSGPGPTNEPFSMTNQAAVTLKPLTAVNLDYALVASQPPPQLTLACSAPNGSTTSAYDSFLVANGGVAPYTYSVVPAGSLPVGLNLDSTSGHISGTPTVPGDYTFTAQVVDSSGNTAINTVTQSCALDISPPPLVLTCSGGTGQVGVFYDSFLTTVGGVPPYTYQIITGALPDGLTLNGNTGEISGTPTTAGPSSFTAQVTDFSGDTDENTSSQSCGIVTAPPPSANCVSIVAIQGIPITPVQMVGTGGAGAPYTFSATGLPNGLTMASDGTISGTPTVSGTFNYTVTITDKDGHTGTINCSVTVNPPVSATCVSIVAVQGVAITPVTVVGSGGTGGPYTFTATGLPDGLTMSSDGTISGTPTVSGTFSYTVTIKDSAGNTGTINCSVTVNPPVSATCVSIVAVQGVAITPVQMTASGGTGAPYTFSATGLPNGLTMASDGTISGTPTVSGTFSYTVTVTDKDGHTGTVNCSVTVNPPVSATCVSIVAVQGVAITPVKMTASGGTGAPYTFSATGLPNGLTMASDGTISGTPTVSGTFSYTVTVTDKDGHTGTVNCSVTVNPPVSASCVSIVAVQGVAITPVQMTASGGTGAPYTFSAVGLPNGLTMSSDGTISGTPTVSGTFSYTVTVTDKDGHSGTVNCSVTVFPPVTASCVSITAQQGVPITPVTLTASGGVGGPYTFTAIGLPAGLTMSTSGTISGTPTVSGTFTYTVTVKDAAGNIGVINCSVQVAPPPPPPLSLLCPTGTGKVGTLYDSPAQVTGGVAPYTFSLAAGMLPPGLTLNTSTGEIKGTPTTAGTYSFTLKVVDSLGTVAFSSCSSSCGNPSTVVFDFGTVTGVLGTSQNYTTNGVTITAYGYRNGTPNTPTKLYGKNAGGDEVGVGIYGTSSDNEIDTNTFVQVDLANLISVGASIGRMKVGSVQSGESYNIYGSNTLGTLGTALATNQTADNTFFDIPSFGTYRYLSVQAASHDVLLEQVSVTLPAGCSITITGTPTCAVSDSIKSNFNGTAIGANSVVWFNSVLKPTNIPTNIPVTLTFNNVSANFSANGSTYNIKLPNANITYSPTATTATTSYDAGSNTWFTVVPSTYTGNVFLTGGEVNAGSGLPAGITPITLTGTFSSSAVGVSFNWQWAAAVYKNFNTDLNTLGVKPVDDSSLSQYKNSDHAGTPENYKSYVTGGACGGGGSNFTGSYSGTSSVGPFTQTCGSGQPIVHGDTATIGFWHNKNGQALILSMNGSKYSTALGNWLATNFPYLWGPHSPNNLTNATNVQVAAQFMTFFNVTGAKTNAQMMGAALAVYVTSTSLSGGNYAGPYGFNTSTSGIGSHTYNVGGYGSAIGLSNNTAYSVWDLLQQANWDKQNGTFSSNAFNSIFDGINQSGDINSPGQ